MVTIKILIKIILLIIVGVFISVSAQAAENEKVGQETTEDVIGICEENDDCIIVGYAHCCGTTNRAINKKYLQDYLEHPEWQRFFDEDTCAAIGVCADDAYVTEVICGQPGEEIKRCQLMYH